MYIDASCVTSVDDSLEVGRTDGLAGIQWTDKRTSVVSSGKLWMYRSQ